MKRLAAIAILLGGLALPGQAPGQTVQDRDPGLFYEADGEGPPVVFVPAWAHTTTSWFQVLPELRPAGRLVRYDLRGQGRSEAAPDGDYSLQAHVGDLARLIDALDLDRVRLVGAGVGGTVALAYAHRYPERVAAVAAIAPKAGWTDDERAWWVRFLNAYDQIGRPTFAAYTSVLVDRWFGTTFPTLNPWVVGFYDLMLRRQDPAPLLVSLERWLATDFARESSRDMPVLAVWGGLQRSIRGENRIRAAFPRYEREIVRDAGERPEIAAPREVARIVAGFFDRQAPP